MQITLHVNKTINFNHARQIIPSNHQQPSNINMNIKTDPNGDQYDDNNNESDSERNTDQYTTDDESLTTFSSNASDDDYAE